MPSQSPRQPGRPSPADPVAIRAAEPADAAAVAEVWLRSYRAALPGVRQTHSDDEVRDWIRTVIIPGGTTWVAVAADTVVGLMVAHDGWIDQLYLEPTWRGRGLGDQFVELAKRLCPDGLRLWTFQVNTPARRFYQRHGFTEVLLTDGAGNEEQEPDVQYQWLPTAPA